MVVFFSWDQIADRQIADSIGRLIWIAISSGQI